MDRCTPSVPCGDPDIATTSPRFTVAPEDTDIEDRYESDTLNPGTGSMVTVFIPATVPAKLTRPDAGARTGFREGAA